MRGTHKIGAAISGPRIAGGKFMDIALFLNLLALHVSVCRPAGEPNTGKPPKLVPTRESALRSALRNRGALRSAPESALERALPVVLHRTNSWRALQRAPDSIPILRALLRALSGAQLEVSLFWGL